MGPPIFGNPYLPSYYMVLVRMLDEWILHMAGMLICSACELMPGDSIALACSPDYEDRVGSFMRTLPSKTRSGFRLKQSC